MEREGEKVINSHVCTPIIDKAMLRFSKAYRLESIVSNCFCSPSGRSLPGHGHLARAGGGAEGEEVDGEVEDDDNSNDDRDVEEEDHTAADEPG